MRNLETERKKGKTKERNIFFDYIKQLKKRPNLKLPYNYFIEMKILHHTELFQNHFEIWIYLNFEMALPAKQTAAKIEKFDIIIILFILMERTKEDVEIVSVPNMNAAINISQNALLKQTN